MRRKNKWSNKLSITIGVLTLAMVFGFIGFSIGYYRQSNQISQIDFNKQRQQQKLINSLLRTQDGIKNQTVINTGDTISQNTKIIYKTKYTQCGSIIEEEQPMDVDLIGLSEEGLKEYIYEKYQNSEVESFSNKKVVISKIENKVCPNHYKVSVHQGYIAVYKFDEEGEKHLVERTKIPVNHLPVIDQEKLQRGILVENLEEVNKLLEDYSS